MAERRMKLDYNNLLRQIDEVMSISRSKLARENGFGIAVGLSLLTSYMKQIAERAIELNDDVLLGLLLDLHIISKNEGGDNGKN